MHAITIVSYIWQRIWYLIVETKEKLSYYQLLREHVANGFTTMKLYYEKSYNRVCKVKKEKWTNVFFPRLKYHMFSS